MSSVYDSPEFAAHMEAIRANLACDIPRLVLADRLEEWGEVKWANFIRKQIHKPDNRGWISDYVFTHESHDWVNLNLRDFVGSEAASVVQPGNQYSSYLKYARGFLVEIRCTLADWLGGVCPTCGGTGALAEEIYDGATPIGVSGFGCESCGGVKGSNQISDWGNPQVGH